MKQLRYVSLTEQRDQLFNLLVAMKKVIKEWVDIKPMMNLEFHPADEHSDPMLTINNHVVVTFGMVKITSPKTTWCRAKTSWKKGFAISYFVHHPGTRIDPPEDEVIDYKNVEDISQAIRESFTLAFSHDLFDTMDIIAEEQMMKQEDEEKISCQRSFA